MKYITISKREGQLLLKLETIGASWFRIKDIYSIMSDMNKASIRSLLKRMKDKGLIINLSGDLYWVVPFGRDANEFIPNWHLLASALMDGKDYYIGYYSALQLHGLTTQPSLKEQTVTRCQLQDKRIKGIEFQFITHNDKHFFGTRRMWIDSHNKVLCSDMEKTFIDCLFHPEYGDGTVEIAKAMWIARNKIDYLKLLQYCKQFGNKTVCKRMGYLLETLGIGKDIIPELQKMKNDAISLLDTSDTKEGRISSRWSLKINVENDAIFNAIEN